MSCVRKCRRASVLTVLLALALAAPAAAAGLDNAGFDSGLDHWPASKLALEPSGYYDYDPEEAAPQPVGCQVPAGVCVIAGNDTFEADGGGYDGEPVTHTVTPPEGTHMV